MEKETDLIRKEHISYRDLRISDMPFILDSWLRSLYRLNSWFEEIDEYIYKKEYPKVVNACIARSQTRLACLRDDDDVILGYSVIQSKILHYTFVKEPWRKIGIMNELVPEDIDTVSHLTVIGRSIARKRKYIFNPFV